MSTFLPAFFPSCGTDFTQNLFCLHYWKSARSKQKLFQDQEKLHIPKEKGLLFIKDCEWVYNHIIQFTAQDVSLAAAQMGLKEGNETNSERIGSSGLA